ncbi:hypothetical protein LTR96_011371 [Exophiala xenobiotica]|nr:hypothetical protein LTR41_011615 [Exophiala xenobiotica]KAK5220950.1 hypothetical protein LTR47_010967 [Exophiala xenobiotica]KAK5263200.1 hypothetical protein LTR96_011371 [Exophiala xenobiotica]KAK5282479.1 hypothetical protein LTR40_003233 [Exophiala xenobiotica]KAK5332781.1 hypothetical protein LTR98_011077 [Exophiala xenobiotica]
MSRLTRGSKARGGSDFFTEFAEKVQRLQSKVPIRLSREFRSRNGMADAIDSGACQLIGLGRTAVLLPTLPKDILLSTAIPDDEALAMPHEIRGMWLANMAPVKIVGASMAGQVFYYNMRRMGSGLAADPYVSVPYVIFSGIMGLVRGTLSGMSERLMGTLRGVLVGQTVKSD